jgi:hypothetical protein
MSEADFEPYVRAQFFLAPDMVEFLREQAAEHNASQGALVRAAIRAYAKKKDGIILDPEHANGRYAPTL